MSPMEWVKLEIPADIQSRISSRGGTPIGAALVMRGARTLRTYVSIDDSGRTMEYHVHLSVIDGGVQKQPNELDVQAAAKYWFGLSDFRVEATGCSGVDLWAALSVAKAKGVV